MALVNVYGFTDSGKKVKIGEYYEALSVGGRIFYINENSTATYKFYDANMVEIASVAVGDTPAYYEVLTEDPNGIDKYYIYNPSIGVSKSWGYENVTTVATAQTIGSGKTNTSAVLAITDTSTYASNSIWTWLQEQRTNKLGGCDDWFIGSEDELEQLRLYLVANADGSTIVNFFTEKVWTSSNQVSAATSCPSVWFPSYWTSAGKSHSACGCAIRSM